MVQSPERAVRAAQRGAGSGARCGRQFRLVHVLCCQQRLQASLVTRLQLEGPLPGSLCFGHSQVHVVIVKCAIHAFDDATRWRVEVGRKLSGCCPGESSLALQQRRDPSLPCSADVWLGVPTPALIVMHLFCSVLPGWCMTRDSPGKSTGRSSQGGVLALVNEGCVFGAGWWSGSQFPSSAPSWSSDCR